MTGYQKLKEENERLKKERDHHLRRATCYFFTILNYTPQEKKTEAAQYLEAILSEFKETKETCKTDPAVQALKVQNENR